MVAISVVRFFLSMSIKLFAKATKLEIKTFNLVKTKNVKTNINFLLNK